MSVYGTIGPLVSNYFFEKNLSGIPSECQTLLTLIRPDDSLGLIWVQTVCQGYQQMTLVDKELMELQFDKTKTNCAPINGCRAAVLWPSGF